MGSTSSTQDVRAAGSSPQRRTVAALARVISRAMREPLVQFLAAGLMVFLVYAMLHPERFAADTSRRIELSATEVQRVDLAFRARWQRQPTPTELQALLASEVRNEILSREAIALGLDKDDVIVKRRLAQKMEFLAEDVSNLREPTRDELRAWFNANKNEFTQSSRVSFRHAFFSTDRRGPGAEQAARKALVASARSGAAPSGDPFMFQDQYSDRTAQHVAEVFGSDFAKTVFAAPLGRWSGPYASGLGWHIVSVEGLQVGEVPAFEEVEAEVRERWVLEQREATKAAAFKAMLARYVIVMPDMGAGHAAAALPRSR